MNAINIPAKFVSFSIEYRDNYYSATVYYKVNSFVGHLSSDTSWGRFDDAKKWVEEITGITIE